MRILFLHEVNYLTKPIFEMHEYPEHLSSKGHEVAFLHFPEGFSISEVKSLGWKTKINGRVLSLSKITLFTPQVSPGSSLGRAIHFLLGFFFISRAIREFAPDIVVSYAFPTFGLQGLYASRRARVPYLSRVIDVSHKIRKFAAPGIIRFLERRIYAGCDWLSANNCALLGYCCQMASRQINFSVELPPLNISHFSSQSSLNHKVKSALGIPIGSKVILYMGTFFYFSGLSEVIRSFSYARKQNEYLVLVGGGEQDSELRQLVRDLDLERVVIFTGYVTFEDLPKFLAIATVAINPMLKSTVSQFGFPNKVLQYMASAKPVSSTRLKSLESILEESQSLLFGETPTEVLGNALQLTRLDKADLLGFENQKRISEVFNLEIQVRDFENLLQKVADLK